MRIWHPKSLCILMYGSFCPCKWWESNNKEDLFLLDEKCVPKTRSKCGSTVCQINVFFFQLSFLQLPLHFGIRWKTNDLDLSHCFDLIKLRQVEPKWFVLQSGFCWYCYFLLYIQVYRVLIFIKETLQLSMIH